MLIPEPSSRISLSNVTVAGDVRGGGTGREHAANLLGDGSQEWNKWLHPDTDGTSWISVELSEPAVIGAYTMQAANDCPDRDPADWILLGKSEEDDCYVELARVKGATFSRRYARQTYAVFVRTRITAVRWEITKRQGPGVSGHIQLAHVALHEAVVAPPRAARRLALLHSAHSPAVVNELAIYEGQKTAHTGVVAVDAAAVAPASTDDKAAGGAGDSSGGWTTVGGTGSRSRRFGGASTTGPASATTRLGRGSKAWWSPLPSDKRAFFQATIQGPASGICGFSIRSSARPGSHLRDPLNWRLQGKDSRGSWTLLADASEDVIRWGREERGAVNYFPVPNTGRATFSEVKFEVRGSVKGAAVELGGFAVYGE